jgi:GT2 family glycosyltransferase
MPDKKIIFIADFYVDQVLGGGEINNEELYQCLTSQGHQVVKERSHNITAEYVLANQDSFFIVFNFINLSYAARTALQKTRYIIYEHDHKYIKSRNPATYTKFKAPKRDIINYHFYKNAQRVLCQSQLHYDIITLNLGIDNVESLGGNLWSDQSLSALEEMCSLPKKKACSVMASSIDHKNTKGAAAFCESHDLDFDLVSDNDYISFLKKLGSNEKLVFFPRTPETLSRIAVEARMMGMSVITNNLVGATTEPWFEAKGRDLINIMRQKKKDIVSRVLSLVNSPVEKRNSQYEVSIISTFYKGEDFLQDFLQNLTQQTIFKKCELVLVDTGSPGKERQIVEKFLSKHSNIKYVREEQRYKPTRGMNIALRHASAGTICWAMIDDRKNKDCIENLYQFLLDNPDVDLVYGDCLVTDVKNENPEETKSKTVSEHSSLPFSRENMVKCLPGPMPLYRKTLHEKNGFFDEDDCDYADDWEMWLRAVESGSKFKKFNKVVGLYYNNGRSTQEDINQRKEEAKIFFKYQNVFGDGFLRYRSYFGQFL